MKAEIINGVLHLKAQNEKETIGLLNWISDRKFNVIEFTPKPDFTERNKNIMRLRNRGWTYKNISDKFGISQSRTRKIYINEIFKIKHYGTRKK